MHGYPANDEDSYGFCLTFQKEINPSTEEGPLTLKYVYETIVKSF